MPTMMETALIPIAHEPMLDPRLRAEKPIMIPRIPNIKGIMNNERMEMINAMAPIPVPPDVLPEASDRPFILLSLGMVEISAEVSSWY